MDKVQIGKKLVSLRNEKHLTQEEVADFVGVSRAAVSKWEKRQSFPDIFTLPKLAALYGISIDELIGYEAQMEEKKIQELCIQLSHEMLESGFSSPYAKIEKLVKKFYYCYPLVLSFSILLMNYYYMSEDLQEQEEVLNNVRKWCRHIAEDCNSPNTIQKAVAICNCADLGLGRHKDIIKELMIQENQIQQFYSEQQVLIRTFLMLEEYGSAEHFIEELRSNSILGILDSQILTLHCNFDNGDKCAAVILQTEQWIGQFELEKKQPYAVMQFYYSAAVCNAWREEKEETVKYLNLFYEIGRKLLRNSEKYCFDSFYSVHFSWESQKISRESQTISGKSQENREETDPEPKKLKPRQRIGNIKLGQPSDNMKPDQKQIYFELTYKIREPVFSFLKDDEQYLKLVKNLEADKELTAFINQVKDDAKRWHLRKKKKEVPM